MSVKLLIEHHLAFQRIKGGCTGWSESTLVKMPHCWKSHVMGHFMYIQKVQTSLCILKSDQNLCCSLLSRYNSGLPSFLKNVYSCTPNTDIRVFTLGKKPLSYPCYLTQAVTWGLHTLVVLELTHMVVKWRHSYVKVMSSCEITF